MIEYRKWKKKCFKTCNLINIKKHTKKYPKIEKKIHDTSFTIMSVNHENSWQLHEWPSGLETEPSSSIWPSRLFIMLWLVKLVIYSWSQNKPTSNSNKSETVVFFFNLLRSIFHEIPQSYNPSFFIARLHESVIFLCSTEAITLGLLLFLSYKSHPGLLAWYGVKNESKTPFIWSKVQDNRINKEKTDKCLPFCVKFLKKWIDFTVDRLICVISLKEF